MRATERTKLTFLPRSALSTLLSLASFRLLSSTALQQRSSNHGTRRSARIGSASWRLASSARNWRSAGELRVRHGVHLLRLFPNLRGCRADYGSPRRMTGVNAYEQCHHLTERYLDMLRTNRVRRKCVPVRISSACMLTGELLRFLATTARGLRQAGFQVMSARERVCAVVRRAVMRRSLLSVSSCVSWSSKRASVGKIDESRARRDGKTAEQV